MRAIWVKNFLGTACIFLRQFNAKNALSFFVIGFLLSGCGGKSISLDEVSDSVNARSGIS